MSVFLHGLALQFYRGVGPEIQRLRNFRDFNFFVGANNSGKSTILNFIAQHLSPETTAGGHGVSKGIVQYRGKITGDQKFGIGIPAEVFIDAAIQTLPEGYKHQARPLVSRVTNALADHGLVWMTADGPHGEKNKRLFEASPFERVLNRDEWYQLYQWFTRAASGEAAEWRSDVLRRSIGAQNLWLPAARLIPAKREIGPKGDQLEDFTGRGLIDKLAEIQSPDHDQRHDREIFDRINTFLQKVTGSEGATIEVPHNRDHVLVHMDNKVLPLASLGTGIHEVIMIAAFCTITRKQLCLYRGTRDPPSPCLAEEANTLSPSLYGQPVFHRYPLRQLH